MVDENVNDERCVTEARNAHNQVALLLEASPTDLK